MEQVQAASLRLAERTGDQLVALWRQVDGVLTVSRFRTLAATLVAQANAKGVSLVDLGLTAEVIRQIGTRTAPLGLRPNTTQVSQSRIARNIDSILADTPAFADTPDAVAESREARLYRMGRSEPLLTVATTMKVAMERRQISGWTRLTSGKSCPLCSAWADGEIRPPSVPMARHLGCDCIQQPVF